MYCKSTIEILVGFPDTNHIFTSQFRKGCGSVHISAKIFFVDDIPNVLVSLLFEAQ